MRRSLWDPVRWVFPGLVTLLLAGCGVLLPPDAELVRRFETSRAVFDSLAALADADTSVTFLAHREDLQRRMHRFGLWGLQRRWGELAFPVGSNNAGWQKVYVRIASTCIEPVASLDGPFAVTNSYRQLEVGWYLALRTAD